MKISGMGCQVLVIGGGGAGTTAAIAAAREGVNVVLVTQGAVGRSGLSVMAGGGIGVVGRLKDPRDSVDLHFRDVVERGHYLGDQNLIEVMTREAPERALELEKFGARLLPVNYYRGKILQSEMLQTVGSLGYSFRRGYHLIGSTMMNVLRRELSRHPEITLLEDYFICKLLTCEGLINGALALDIQKGEFVLIKSPTVILATGGTGELYSSTTNAPQRISGNARGTGFALALHAGAKLVDMEMTQFYPATSVWPPVICGIHLGIIEEFVANAGAKILNVKGQEFLEMPLVRDVTARRIYQEIKAGRGTKAGGVFLDVTKSPLPAKEYSNIIRAREPGYKQYKNLGIDITKDPFEVAPSFHFQVGGVRINEQAESSLPGLFAAGEVSGNTHGANRLGGNAVAELLVFGPKAGQNAARRAIKEKALDVDMQQVEQEIDKIETFFQAKKDSVRLSELRRRLADTMYAHVGLSRTAQSISKALEEIERLAAAICQIQVCDCKIFNLGLVEAKEVELMIDTARVIATSALIRRESRGAHYREDYPQPDYKNWTKHVVLQKKGDKLEHTFESVIFTRLKPPETNQWVSTDSS